MTASARLCDQVSWVVVVKDPVLAGLHENAGQGRERNRDGSVRETHVTTSARTSLSMRNFTLPPC